ncbi:MAG: Gmad2 immunoglobulin-like domain-containing protein, partial [Acidimicrobiales bacterium]
MTFPSLRPVVRRWAGASAVVLLSSLTLVACGGSDDHVPTSGRTSEPTRTKTPSPSAASDTSSSESGESGESGESSETPTESAATVVPIYFVGDGPSGPALFREFHRVSGNPLTEAARLVMGGGEAHDPDYRTLWPQVEVADVGATDGVLLVQIAGDAFTERPDGMSRREAALAMQQLVFTLQGVQQERVPVVVKREGDLPILGLATDGSFTNASALDTLNLVSITSPAEGDTVSGDALKVTGVANSVEASGPCRLISGGQEIALEGYQAEGWMEDRLFPFEVELP